MALNAAPTRKYTTTTAVITRMILVAGILGKR
jgi:hypothetical protein